MYPWHDSVHSLWCRLHPFGTLFFDYVHSPLRRTVWIFVLCVFGYDFKHVHTVQVFNTYSQKSFLRVFMLCQSFSDNWYSLLCAESNYCLSQSFSLDPIIATILSHTITIVYFFWESQDKFVLIYIFLLLVSICMEDTVKSETVKQVLNVLVFQFYRICLCIWGEHGICICILLNLYLREVGYLWSIDFVFEGGMVFVFRFYWMLYLREAWYSSGGRTRVLFHLSLTPPRARRAFKRFSDQQPSLSLNSQIGLNCIKLD